MHLSPKTEEEEKSERRYEYVFFFPHKKREKEKAPTRARRWSRRRSSACSSKEEGWFGMSGHRIEEHDLIRECEQAIRENRKQQRAADRLFNRIPCKDPSRGPNLSEVLNYYGEKNKAMQEIRRKPKPASAFNAGSGDNGSEDITDLPACYRPGSGFDLNEELRKNPDLLDQVRRRAAANIGVNPQQVQYLNHQATRRRTDDGGSCKNGDGTGASCVAKLPDEIAQGNSERKCQYCGFAGTRYRCSRCRSVFYCSASCQKRDWLHHKTSCEKLL